MVLGDVVDELHDDHGLAHARPAKQADLAALQKRLNEIDDFHAGLEHLRRRGLFVERRRQAMDWHSFRVLNRAKLVHRLADYIHHSAQRAAAHRDRDGPVLVNGVHAAHHPVGGRHGDAPHAPFAQVLLYLENHVDRARHGEAVAHHSHRLVDRRQLAFGKLNVHRRSRNLNDMSDVFCHMFFNSQQ